MTTTAVTQPRRRMGLLAVGALAGVLAAAIAAPSLAAAADSTDAQTKVINVSGTGTIKIKPDVADLSVGVQITRDRADAASIDAATEMDKVIKALKKAGIAEDDIQTTTLGLDPNYDYNNSPATLTGYTATNIVSVTIRDLTTVGAVIDSAVEAGANNVSGLSFRLDDNSAATSQARTLAVQNAKAAADELAAAAGVTITGVVSITEQSASVPQPIYYGDMAAAGAMRDAAPTPVQAGNVDVTVIVSVTYSIS
ncbi:MAG: SIMPL domain-containing protein [Chloroflexota bacterium]